MMVEENNDNPPCWIINWRANESIHTCLMLAKMKKWRNGYPMAVLDTSIIPVILFWTRENQGENTYLHTKELRMAMVDRRVTCISLTLSGSVWDQFSPPSQTHFTRASCLHGGHPGWWRQKLSRLKISGDILTSCRLHPDTFLYTNGSQGWDHHFHLE